MATEVGLFKWMAYCAMARDVVESSQFAIGWALSQLITSSAFWSGGNTG
jgi:hypothetical protein